LVGLFGRWYLLPWENPMYSAIGLLTFPAKHCRKLQINYASAALISSCILSRRRKVIYHFIWWNLSTKTWVKGKKCYLFWKPSVLLTLTLILYFVWRIYQAGNTANNIALNFFSPIPVFENRYVMYTWTENTEFLFWFVCACVCVCLCVCVCVCVCVCIILDVVREIPVRLIKLSWYSMLL
jgi:hypothetical protein